MRVPAAKQGTGWPVPPAETALPGSGVAAVTDVVASVAVAPAVSVSPMLKTVVTVWPGATPAGVNTNPRSAAVTVAAEPVSV